MCGGGGGENIQNDASETKVATVPSASGRPVEEERSCANLECSSRVDRTVAKDQHSGMSYRSKRLQLKMFSIFFSWVVVGRKEVALAIFTWVLQGVSLSVSGVVILNPLKFFRLVESSSQAFRSVAVLHSMIRKGLNYVGLQSLRELQYALRILLDFMSTTYDFEHWLADHKS